MATERINFNIQGMTCQACANRIEKVLNKKDFVENCTVNFAGETAQIEFDDTQTNIDELIKIIEKTGYQATVQTSWQPESNSETHWRVWALLGLSLPFWIGMLGMMFGLHILMLPILLQILIATVVQTYFALPFYTRCNRQYSWWFGEYGRVGIGWYFGDLSLFVGHGVDEI